MIFDLVFSFSMVDYNILIENYYIMRVVNLTRQSSQDSPSYLDETILNTSKTDRNIFSKLFGFMGLEGDITDSDGSI